MKGKKRIMGKKLTKSELAIMETLWNEGKAMTATEIVKAAGDEKIWKNSSVHLLINQLLNKEIVEVAGFQKTVKNYARTFIPAISKEKYLVDQMTEGITEEGRKKLYEYLIEEENSEMLEYIQKLIDKHNGKINN